MKLHSHSCFFVKNSCNLFILHHYYIYDMTARFYVLEKTSLWLHSCLPIFHIILVLLWPQKHVAWTLVWRFCTFLKMNSDTNHYIIIYNNCSESWNLVFKVKLSCKHVFTATKLQGFKGNLRRIHLKYIGHTLVMMSPVLPKHPLLHWILLFVSLFFVRITEKLLVWFPRNLVEGCSTGQGRNPVYLWANLTNRAS